jgi:hypothetical protein
MCRENSDVLRSEFSKKNEALVLNARARQVEDNTQRRVNALREEAAWAECAAFEDFKAEMAGVAGARKRAEDKHLTERQLDEQLREKARRRAEEAEREAAEVRAAEKVQAERAAAQAAREEAAAAAARALSAEIRLYNECAPSPLFRPCASKQKEAPLVRGSYFRPCPPQKRGAFFHLQFHFVRIRRVLELLLEAYCFFATSNLYAPPLIVIKIAPSCERHALLMSTLFDGRITRSSASKPSCIVEHVK